VFVISTLATSGVSYENQDFRILETRRASSGRHWASPWPSFGGFDRAVMRSALHALHDIEARLRAKATLT
jgi:hypothetical protein